MSEGIEPKLLKGHNEAVTCLAYNQSTGTLLSGSEDGTVRIWYDLSSDNPCHYSLRVEIGENYGDIEVNSVAFHPDYDDDTCKIIYVAAGCSLFEYNLMDIVDSKLKFRDLSDIMNNEDDINQVSVQKVGNDLYISTCDDDGEIHISFNDSDMKVISHSSSKTPEQTVNDITGAAIVTSAAFRPPITCKSRKNSNKGKKKNNSGSMNKMLISGGTDCIVKLWDIEKPHSSTYSLTMKTMGSEENVNQVCNPPMVHHLDWSISGKLVAAGLGDGSITILKVEGKRMIELDRLFRDGHNVAVACVCWPRYVFDAKNDVANDRLLISGGSDGFILLWDIGINSSPLAKPPNEFLDVSSSTSINESRNYFDSLDQPKIIYRINHGKKLNWMTSRTLTETSALEIIVADVSNNIAIYTVPRKEGEY